MEFQIIVPITLRKAALLGIDGCSKKAGEAPPPQNARSGREPTNMGTSQTNAPSTPLPQQTSVPRSTPANSLITWTPTLVHEMDRHNSANWQMANWSNGNPFANTWQPDNISFTNGIMTITLDNKGCPNKCDGKPYASGEYRTINEAYGYGYYETRMKPASGKGLMSGSFFVYRGVYGQSSHDEIDLEFLGKSCDSIQVNYYVEGKGGHEKMIPLPFDACKEFHNYGFKWSPEEIVFFVDGKEIHKAKEDPSTPKKDIPYRPGRIMVNLWAGTSEVNAWLNGPFTYPKQPVKAEYDWIKYSTLDAAGRR